MMVYLLIYHDTAVRYLTIRIRQIFIVIPLFTFNKFGSILQYGYGIFVLIYRSLVNTFVLIESSVWIRRRLGSSLWIQHISIAKKDVVPDALPPIAIFTCLLLLFLLWIRLLRICLVMSVKTGRSTIFLITFSGFDILSISLKFDKCLFSRLLILLILLLLLLVMVVVVAVLLLLLLFPFLLWISFSSDSSSFIKNPNVSKHIQYRDE